MRRERRMISVSQVANAISIHSRHATGKLHDRDPGRGNRFLFIPVMRRERQALLADKQMIEFLFIPVMRRERTILFVSVCDGEGKYTQY